MINVQKVARHEKLEAASLAEQLEKGVKQREEENKGRIQVGGAWVLVQDQGPLSQVKAAPGPELDLPLKVRARWS